MICVTETWLSDITFDHEILPPNYTIFRCDRNAHGGGVLIGVSTDIPSAINHSSNSIELVAVDLLLSPRVTLCCLYIPPGCSASYVNDLVFFT